jgi:hypothetical protein
MAKLTIQDVFDMFEPFGIRAERVTAVLNSCKDKGEADNAFEGLKGLVTARYEEMRGGGVSSERFQKVKPIYERLIKISLKNYNPPKGKGDPANEKVRAAANIYELIKSKDIAGLSRLLENDAVDPQVEQDFVQRIIDRFDKKK